MALCLKFYGNDNRLFLFCMACFWVLRTYGMLKKSKKLKKGNVGGEPEGLIISGFPAGIYLLKVNYRNTRTSCEICSKLTIKIP